VKVTPLDIRRKEFKRSVRGYADEEVDLFLDEVADELERLAAENAELLERLRRQEGELSGNMQLRGVLEKTLVSAQIQADDTVAKARAEADHLLREAESRAQGIVSESYAEVQRVQQALVQLKQLEEDFRSKFQSLLQGHLKVLAEPAIAIPVADPVVMQSPQPVSVSVSSTPAPAETPFVVPAGFEEVPEFQGAGAIAQGVTPAAVRPAVLETTAVAETAPAAEEVPLVVPAVLQPPEPLLWHDETGDTVTEDTGTIDFEAVPPVALDDLTGSMSDSPTVASDDSVTLVGEDPLHGFFFSGKDDAGAEAQPGDGKGKTNRPRDFEW
jgi:cell division initiation protein